MKKAITILITILILCCLTACQSNNSVANLELTERESILASTRSDQTYMYEYRMGKEYTSFRLFVEKYEYGKKTDEVELSHSYGERGTNRSGMIVLCTTQDDDSPSKFIFNTSVFSDDGVQSFKEFTDVMEGGIQYVTKLHSSAMPDSNRMGLLCVRAHEEGFSGLGQEFFADYEKYLDQIKEDDVTYLFVCEFDNYEGEDKEKS